MSALEITAALAGVVTIIVAVTMYQERHRILALRCGNLTVDFEPARTGGDPPTAELTG